MKGTVYELEACKVNELEPLDPITQEYMECIVKSAKNIAAIASAVAEGLILLKTYFK